MAQLELLKSVSPASVSGKSEGAYKTISEVSEELDVPQHVLRFWESHFPQVKPSRMRGSRRYYRPEDIDVLKKIKSLLYSQGYTIKGAKKMVREKDPMAEIAKAMEKELAEKSVLSVPVPPPVISAQSREEVKSLLSELRSLKQLLASVTRPH